MAYLFSQNSNTKNFNMLSNNWLSDEEQSEEPINKDNHANNKPKQENKSSRDSSGLEEFSSWSETLECPDNTCLSNSCTSDWDSRTSSPISTNKNSSLISSNTSVNNTRNEWVKVKKSKRSVKAKHTRKELKKVDGIVTSNKYAIFEKVIEDDHPNDPLNP